MSTGLTRLIRSLALMKLIKNLGRHNLHPLKRISSRDSITTLERFLPSWKRLRREKTSSRTLLDLENSDGTKGTRCIPYYLITIHEQAGDECAHEQLIADRFRLWYRDTSLPVPSEATRTLPRTEPWVSAWLEFFFWHTPKLLLDVVDEDGGTAWSARNITDARDGLVAGWPKLAGGGTRATVMSNLDGCAAWYWWHWAKVFPFMAAVGLQRSSKPAGVSGVGNTGLDNGQPTRSRRRDRDCRRKWQSGVTASYGRGTERMGFNGLKNRPWWGEEREELRVSAS
jgi:hypothetical protein